VERVIQQIIFRLTRTLGYEGDKSIEMPQYVKLPATKTNNQEQQNTPYNLAC
jgi:hypothetical protein